jgi:hypothetical protein
MDTTAEYRDYVNDVCGFLRTLAADADRILNDATLVASLWRKVVHGWNCNARPAQIAADWYGDHIDTEPVAARPDVPATVLAYRKSRRLLWAAAYLA